MFKLKTCRAVVVVVAVGATAQSAIAAESGGVHQCVIDSTTGYVAPIGAAGLCASTDYTSTRLVQKLDHGFVFAQLIAGPPDIARYDSYGKPVMGVSDPAALLIYCPMTHVDQTTGRPETACISDLATMTPGAEAFVGSGAVTANIAQDDSGGASCPGSIHVLGRLTDPTGARYEISTSAVSTRTSDNGCTTAFHSMDLRPTFAQGTATQVAPASLVPPQASYDRLERAVDVLNRMAATESEDWHELDGLAELDDEQLSVLRWYLAADKKNLDRMDRLLESDGVAYITGNGEVHEAASAAELPAESIIVTNTLASDIKAKVNSILNKVSNIANRVNIVPVRSDVVALIDQLRGSVDMNQVRERIADAGEQLRDFTDEVNARREGLPAFVGNDCDGASPCARFRRDLGRMFDNLETLGYAIQQLVCTQVPSVPTAGIKFNVIRGILVENQRAPKVMLFLMSKVLAQVDDWQLDGLIDEVPIDALEAICAEARGTQSQFKLESAQVIRTSARNSVCAVLRPGAVELALKRSSARVGFMDWLIQQLKALFPEDQTIGLSVIAVGGGGFSVTTKGVPATVSEILIANLSTFKSLTDKLLARREACLNDEERWERDLYTCRPKIEYLTNDSSVQRDLLGFVKRQANAIKKTERPAEIQRAVASKAAREEAERKFENASYRASYDCICNAYQQLVLDPPDVRSCRGL